MMGKSQVFPLDVKLFVPEVLARVQALAPAVNANEAWLDRVTGPRIVIVWFAMVPEYELPNSRPA